MYMYLFDRNSKGVTGGSKALETACVKKRKCTLVDGEAKRGAPETEDEWDDVESSSSNDPDESSPNPCDGESDETD